MKVTFAIKIPAISLEQSSLEPKLLHTVYRNSCTAYRLVTNLVTYRVDFGLLFRGTKFFHSGYLTHFLSERNETWPR